MGVVGGIPGMRRTDSARRGALWREPRSLFAHFGPAPTALAHSTLSDDQTQASNGRERGGGGGTARGEHIRAPAHQPAPGPDDPAFDAFFQRHEQALYGYLRRLLPSDDMAMEAAQEAFFRAWQHFEEVRVYERPEAWLYRVATNLAISQLRRRRPLSFTQAFHRARVEAGDDSDGAEDDLLADPLDIEGDAVTRDLINRALLRLSGRQRAALLLRAVHGFSCEEVAGMLEISVANARQMLSRGRERFRRLYEEALDESRRMG